jgi:hypothetical protein
MTVRVSEIVAMAMGGGGSYGSDGYGFHILSENRLLVTLVFATWEDAEEARAEVARAVERAVEITPHGAIAT